MNNYDQRAAKKRQASLLGSMRKNDYVLSTALRKTAIPDVTFRNWYFEDNEFRAAFHTVQKEQMVFLRQILMEMASGAHPSCEGKPDKSLLRYLIATEDKKRIPIAELDEELKELLDDDVEAMTEEDLEKFLESEEV